MTFHFLLECSFCEICSSVLIDSIWWCGGGESNKWRIQDLEEKHTIPVWSGHDTCSRVAKFDRPVASWREQVIQPPLELSKQCRLLFIYNLLSIINGLIDMFCEGLRERIMQSIGWCWAHTHRMSRTTWSSQAFRFLMTMLSLTRPTTTVRKEVWADPSLNVW